MILTICENVNVLKVLRLVKIVITIIRILVPLCILLPSMINGIKEIVSANEKSIANFFDKIKNRMIASILIFFIPTFITIIVSLVSTDSNNYKVCLDNATPEGISYAKEIDTKSKINKFKNTLSDYDYQQAKNAINDLDDTNDILEIIDEFDYLVSLKEKIDDLSNNYTDDKNDELFNLINNIEDSDTRNTLLEKLNGINSDFSITKKYSSLSDIPFAKTTEELTNYMNSTGKLDSKLQTSYKGSYKIVTINDSGGVDRTFAIYIPYGYNKSKKYNVLLNVPGGNGNATYFVYNYNQGYLKNTDLFDSLAYSGLSDEVIIVGIPYRYINSHVSESSETMGKNINSILEYVISNYSTYASSLNDVSNQKNHFGIMGGSTGGFLLSYILSNSTVQNYFGYICFHQSSYYSINNGAYSSSIPLRLFIAQNASNDFNHNCQAYLQDWANLYSNIKPNDNAISIQFGAYGHDGYSTTLAFYNVLVSFFRY